MSNSELISEMLECLDEVFVELGADVTLARPSLVAAANPWEPSAIGSPAELFQAAVGMFVHYTQKEIDGTVILEGDTRLVLKATDLTVEPNQDQILYEGLAADITGATPKYQVVRHKATRPDGTNLVYVLQLRGVQ